MDAFITSRKVSQVSKSTDKQIPITNSPNSLQNDGFSSRELIQSVALRSKKHDLSEHSFEKCLHEITKNFGHIDGRVQEIKFADSFKPADFKLMEVDKKLLEEITHSDAELVIRGRMSDFVVACTSSKTYQVKECESSNSFLLLPNLQLNDNGFLQQNAQFDENTVVGISKTYLELIEVTSIFSTRLRDLLNEHVLELGDEAQIPPILTWERLMSEIQLSETQLRSSIEKLPVICCKDGCYLLSSASQQRILDEVVELCDDFFVPEITIRKIDSQTLVSKLPFDENLKAFIAQWFLDHFCDKIETSEQFFLNHLKLCRARASEVLRSDKKKDFPIGLFLRLVERVLPAGVDFHLDCLAGIAYIDENLVMGKTVRSLEIADMPDDPRKRLEYLFAINPLWKQVDIEPYMLDFCSSSANAEEFLLKHCRIVRRANEKLFTLKQL